MNKFIIAGLIGAVTGFLAGLQGIAGSFYILTLLLLTGLSDDQRHAAGTTLLTIVFPLSLGAVWTYYKKGDVDIPIALTIIAVYFIFSTLGAKANFLIPQKYTLLSIALMLVLSAGYYVNKYLHLSK